MKDKIVNSLDLQEIKVLEHLPISTQKIKLIQQHTIEDEALQKVVEYINKGSWPTNLKDCNALVRPFFHISEMKWPLILTYCSKEKESSYPRN